MTTVLRYDGQVTTGPSYDLWQNCPVEEIHADPNVGLEHFEDFTKGSPTMSGTTAPVLYGYNYYADDGVSATPASLHGGGLKIAGNDADNDAFILQVGGAALVISDTTGSDKPVWFEACVNKASIADNALSFFVGLAAPGKATGTQGVQTTNTGVPVASMSHIGFKNLCDNGEELDFDFGLSGQTYQEWAAAISEGDFTAIKAATDLKLGFRYNPKAAKKIQLWINGYPYLTDYIDAADIAAATFPDDEALTPTFACKVGTAAEVITYLKWMRWATLR